MVPFTKVGRYQLITRVAMGGMAEVYLARHGELTGFKTVVVLKKVLPHLAANPDFISMFLDEARIASRLDHPHVVRIFEVGRADNEFFLTMEVVQGMPLNKLVRYHQETETLVDQRLASMIIAHAAAGLHHAHGLINSDGTSMSLVHRDVSPQNILVSFEGSVKVIDFGIARALGRLTNTGAGGAKGKLSYMSPEQAKTEEIDARTDIFALGVVLWETICARRLFSRENDLGTMQALLYDPIPPPSEVIEVAPPLERIVMKALSRDPDGRYKTAQEMQLALERYIVQAGGASTAHLARLMKDSFPDEQARWQDMVRTALEVDDPSSIAVIQEQPSSMETESGATSAQLPSARQKMMVRRRWVTIAVAIGVVGLVILIGSLLLSPRAVPVVEPTVRPQVMPRVMPLPAPVRPVPRPTPPPAATVPPPRTEEPKAPAPAPSKIKRPKSAPVPTHRTPASNPKPAPSILDRRPNPF